MGWAWGSDASAVSVTDDVCLHHTVGVEVLAGLLGTGHFVVIAAIEVAADTALSPAVSGAEGDGRVVSGVADEQAELLGEDEHVVLIVLVDLEDLWICVGGEDLVGQGDILSIDGGGGHVIEVDLVLSEVDGDSELVVGDLVSQNEVSWGVGTVSRDEGGAL